MWFLGKWLTVYDSGVHAYQQHSRTGKRRIVRFGRSGYQPCDTAWIETGKFSPMPTVPTTGSAVVQGSS